MVMNMGGQAVVPMKALEGTDTHLHMYMDLNNDAIMLTVVSAEAADSTPNAIQL